MKTTLELPDELARRVKLQALRRNQKLKDAVAQLRSSELTDATLKVTNLGDLGVRAVFGVICSPQVALVGFARIAEQPWANAGSIEARPVLVATLAGDHRATDGRCGAQFLESIGRRFGAPETL